MCKFFNGPKQRLTYFLSIDARDTRFHRRNAPRSAPQATSNEQAPPSAAKRAETINQQLAADSGVERSNVVVPQAPGQHEMLPEDRVPQYPTQTDLGGTASTRSPTVVPGAVRISDERISNTRADAAAL